MFRNLFLLLTVLLIFSSVLFSGIKLLSRPSVEYDEGAYLTTFLLVDKGYKLYEKTFFSQFPGFFYSTYPQFLLFGKNLEAGRIAVFAWSLVTLLGILWLSFELGNILFGILAILILYNIPLFFDQSLTFHADSIPLAFSVLSVASMLRFKRKSNYFWFVLSITFISFSILTKLEISVIPSLILIFLATLDKRKINYKKIFLLLCFSIFLFLAIFYISILPFGGIIPFFNSAVFVRLQSTFSFNSTQNIFSYLAFFSLLSVIIITSIILSFFAVFKIRNKKNKFSFFVLLSWFTSIIFLIMIYRPLFPHHLVLLTVPPALLFSYLVILFLGKILSTKLLNLGILLFTLYTMFNLVNFSIINSRSFRNILQEKGVEIITKNTNPTDYVISDEGFLNAISKRLPAPWLVDISEVRVVSKALSSEVFEKNVEEYKPKLILSWSGRIKKIEGFTQILEKNNYKILEAVDKDHKVFILK